MSNLVLNGGFEEPWPPEAAPPLGIDARYWNQRWFRGQTARLAVVTDPERQGKVLHLPGGEYIEASNTEKFHGRSWDEAQLNWLERPQVRLYGRLLASGLPGARLSMGVRWTTLSGPYELTSGPPPVTHFFKDEPASTNWREALGVLDVPEIAIRGQVFIANDGASGGDAWVDDVYIGFTPYAAPIDEPDDSDAPGDGDSDSEEENAPQTPEAPEAEGAGSRQTDRTVIVVTLGYLALRCLLLGLGRTTKPTKGPARV